LVRGVAHVPGPGSRGVGLVASLQPLLLHPHPPQHPERLNEEVPGPAARVHDRYFGNGVRPTIKIAGGWLAVVIEPEVLELLDQR
jgi:hypothetical protein